jgi:hypothetical protein
MTKQTDAQRIAKLEREIKKLKAARAPPPPAFKPLSAEEHFDQMHQARERAANNFQFSPSVLREMVAACGTADLRDIVHASHAPQGPSAGGIPSSSTITSVHPGGGANIAPGGGTGWRDASPLGPQPGINHVDRLIDEQDRRDRVELAQRLAAQQK